jgi:transcriptional regulator with XRE-family HTH domain
VPKTVNNQKVLRELGRRIRTARQSSDLTQEKAAAAAGIDYKRWQKLEQGTVNATVRTLNRAAAVLGLTFWELVGGPPPKKPRPRRRA